ncbi:MAG: glycosyltransferase family 9 protein [bacterium]
MQNNIFNCKNFNGYKPCFTDHNCFTNGCKNHKPMGKKILIINLDAMGDVVMTTAQLPAIKRKYPDSTIYWVTLKISAGVLENNPFIDKIFPYDFESLSILAQMEFDIAMNVDKSLRSGALIMSVKADNKLGFGIDFNGKIIPLNKGAEYNYLLGMDDNLKFKVNKKTGQEYLADTFDLEYKRDDYVFNFTAEEIEFVNNYKLQCGILENDEIIGFNTGCSNTFPNKKMTINQHKELITRFLAFDRYKIILLGGPEDKERNIKIAEGFDNRVINTPTDKGIRRGACFESIPQLIITGDSFGMHLAIALKKHVIAWFGLSCWTEIDLYDRGLKLFPEKLECAPCWKKNCPFNLECVSLIDLNKIVEETNSYFNNNKK